MTTITIYDDTASWLDEIAQYKDTTIAEVLDEIICDHGNEYMEVDDED